jgi:phospholipase C
MGSFGGSYLNHQWLICACTPKFDDAPQAMRVQLDEKGKLAKRPDSGSANDSAVKLVTPGGGLVTPDGWSINTTQPPYQPSGIPPTDGGDPRMANPLGVSASNRPLPPQNNPTIGDRLSDRHISWAWYAGGYRAALAEGMQPASHKRKIIYGREPGSPMFQPHHQPFNYFSKYAPGTQAREQHLKDGEDFLADVQAGKLPAVSFYKPAGRDTQHPSYTDIVTGDVHISDVLEKLRNSPQWSRMLVIVTYDENGGYWDHVPPPSGKGWGDRWGPGTRIPALLIGPSVKRGFVDHTPYDTTSILKFLTRKFQLEPLAGVRENAGDLTPALQR